MRRTPHPAPKVGDTVCLNDRGVEHLCRGFSHMKTLRMKVTAIDQTHEKDVAMQITLHVIAEGLFADVAKAEASVVIGGEDPSKYLKNKAILTDPSKTGKGKVKRF